MAPVLSFFKKRNDKAADKNLSWEFCIDCSLLWKSAIGLYRRFFWRYQIRPLDDIIKHGIDSCNDCDDCIAECPMGILFKYLRQVKSSPLYETKRAAPILLELQSNLIICHWYARHIASFLNLTLDISIRSLFINHGLHLREESMSASAANCCHISGAPKLTRNRTAFRIKRARLPPITNTHWYSRLRWLRTAPVITVNSETYGKMDADKVKKLFKIKDTKEEDRL